jgi:tRNA(Ile)-lysidine synthase
MNLVEKGRRSLSRLLSLDLSIEPAPLSFAGRQGLRLKAMMRFATALSDLGVPRNDAIGVAVSGGPDSLALLLLGAEERPGLIRAATVDHGLRPEARAEAEGVASLCADRGIPHDILSVTVKGSIQAAAREARYAALADWCEAHGLNWLATAHHADDQAETLLMRLNRGSGLGGLAGVRPSRELRPGLRLIRPLLDRRKAELEGIVAQAGLTATLDPSNRDPAYDRTSIRALLAGSSTLDPMRLAQSAAHLAEAEQALEWATARLFEERVQGNSLDPQGLPPELLRRLMLRLFAQFDESPRGPELSRLLAALAAGRAATLGSVKATSGRRWTFTLAPPRQRNP